MSHSAQNLALFICHHQHYSGQTYILSRLGSVEEEGFLTPTLLPDMFWLPLEVGTLLHDPHIDNIALNVFMRVYMYVCASVCIDKY